MKVEIVDDNEGTKWKPLTLQITLETRDEALEMWHRLNIEDDVFKCEPYQPRDTPLPSRWSTYNLWDIIDDHLGAHNVAEISI